VKRVLFSSLVLLQLWGCKSNDNILQPKPHQDFEDLHQQFHGKYKIVSAVSSDAIDVNMDGNATTDLISEIEVLTTGTITSPYSEIIINEPSGSNPNRKFLFVQAWPQQFVRLGGGKSWDGMEMIPFHADYTFAYDMKVVYRQFDFSPDLKQLIVVSGKEEDPVFSQSAPKHVLVLGDGRIEVVANRKIYTSNGVKQVIVTTTYERFTI
jgi:hypothetical protein